MTAGRGFRVSASIDVRSLTRAQRKRISLKLWGWCYAGQTYREMHAKTALTEAQMRVLIMLAFWEFIAPQWSDIPRVTFGRLGVSTPSSAVALIRWMNKPARLLREVRRRSQ